MTCKYSQVGTEQKRFHLGEVQVMAVLKMLHEGKCLALNTRYDISLGEL
jgi:hypothetical protein